MHHRPYPVKRRPSGISCLVLGAYWTLSPARRTKSVISSFTPTARFRPYPWLDLGTESGISTFPAYILALSQVDEPDDDGWPIIPRPSIGAEIDELESVMGAVADESAILAGSSPEKTGAEHVETVGGDATLLPGLTLTFSAPSTAEEVVQRYEPESSFRPASTKKFETWDDSSSESSGSDDDDEEEDDDEDEAPLTQLHHRRSFPATALSSSSTSLQPLEQPRRSSVITTWPK